MEDIYTDLNDSFELIYSALRRDLARIRTGRAHVSLLDGIKVDYYGQPTALSQVASIQVPEARTITIKPWEASLINDIERTLINSGLGLTPSNVGGLIRLQIPPLTEERRKSLGKQVQAEGEQAKVSARNHRRDSNQLLKGFQKEGDLSEDELQRSLKHIQTLTDQSIIKIDQMVTKKQEELQEV
jgi:ribosome recycling factor